jgi:hypothetical protein
MKRLATVLLAMAVGLSVSAFAQDNSSSSQSGSSGAAAQSGATGQGDASTAGTASSGQTGTTGSEAGSSSSAPKAKLEHLKGTIGQDGTTFTAGKDQKSWTIMNPEAVKGHEGHHVRVSAHVYPDKNQIHVMSVKMAKGSKEKAGNSGGMGASGSSSGGSTSGQTSSGQPPRR